MRRRRCPTGWQEPNKLPPGRRRGRERGDGPGENDHCHPEEDSRRLQPSQATIAIVPSRSQVRLFGHPTSAARRPKETLRASILNAIVVYLTAARLPSKQRRRGGAATADEANALAPGASLP